jgi:thioredoxin reductase
MQFDVLIVGGGPAGLSAALILGRCHRKALLCDEGRQRNLGSHAIHGLFGREGRSPSDFLDEALKELSRYKSVEVRGTQVTDIALRARRLSSYARTGRTVRRRRCCLRPGSSTSSPNLPG